jgi:hypothetical protein
MDVFIADAYMALKLLLLIIFFNQSAFALAKKNVPVPLAEEKDEETEVFVPNTKFWASADWLNWQEEGLIKAGGFKNRLIITNRALCAGGGYSYNQEFYRLFVEACLFSGKGNAGSEKNSITYNQSDISLYGVKAALGAGRFVSTIHTEIGFKLPMMYVNQTFNHPPSGDVTAPPSTMLMASLYSRWPFEKWFVQTEFSKFIGNDLTLFSLGGGYEF